MLFPPATKVDPVNAIGASVDISAGQGVATTTMHEAPSRETHPPPPDRIRLGTAEPGETEQAGFESSQLDMLPEQISPRINRARF